MSDSEEAPKKAEAPKKGPGRPKKAETPKGPRNLTREKIAKARGAEIAAVMVKD